MKLLKVQTTNTTTKEVINFSLNDTSVAQRLFFTRNSRLQRLVEGCFLVTKFSEAVDIVIDFEIEGDLYTIKRAVDEDGVKTTLRLRAERTSVVARDEKIVPYLEKKIGGSLRDVILECYAGNSQFNRFIINGDLRTFGHVQKLLAVADKVDQNYQETKAIAENARERAKRIKEEVGRVDKGQVELAASQLSDKQKTLFALQQQQAQISMQINDPVIKSARAELLVAQEKYSKLSARREAVDAKRQQLLEYDSVQIVVPQLRSLDKAQADLKESLDKRFDLIKEIDYYEEEYKSITKQISQKQRQLENAVANLTKVEIVKEEMERVATISESNQELEDSLARLKTQEDKVNYQKLELRNALLNIENNITELKAEIEGMSMPEKPMSELVESLKITVKLDEIEAQIDRIRGENSVREGKLAESERALTVQSRQLKSILALDSSVAPLKARDVIMQVIDAKIKKIDMISASLKQKESNLSRSLEKMSNRLPALEQSCQTLATELSKQRLKKGEEFKREVLLNSQKMYQDITAVYAIEASLEDVEIQEITVELNARNLEKSRVMAEIARIQGAIEEIKRHVDINDAEVAGLNKQKENIVSRYNQIINENSNEGVYNYLRALEADKGTKYLLDVQQETVRNETQIQEMKRLIESGRAKISELENRYNSLSKTQEAMQSEGALDILVGANEQTKSELQDAILRLTALYEKHKAMSGRIEELDAKLFQLHETILETQKTIKINEKEIAMASRKAETVAGGDVEQMLQEAEYMQSDVEAENRMLEDSKQRTETELMTRRVEVRKLDWIIESKKEEVGDLRVAIRQLFDEKHIDPSWVNSVAVLQNEDVESIRKMIADYDNARTHLSDKIDNLQTVLGNAPTDKQMTQLGQLLDSLNRQITGFQREVEQSTISYNNLLRAYLATNKLKADLATASGQLQSADALEKNLESSRVVSIIIKDKIRQFVKNAEEYLKVMNPSLSISWKDELVVRRNGKITDIKALSSTEQVFIYVALELAVPSAADVRGKWLIVDEKLECDKQQLDAALRKIGGINFVSEYHYEKSKIGANTYAN